jgi:hypothetical protein
MKSLSQLSRSALAAPRQLLTRLLEEPHLISLVQSLEPHSLGKLIQYVGVEDAGELIALASTEQLIACFDVDLWSSGEPGTEERFDLRRFALWLQVMLEAGEDFVAQKLTELPLDLVLLACNRQMLVINHELLNLQMASYRQEEVDLTEKALDSCLYHEFAEYQVIAKEHEGWDALVSVLLALDKNHGDFLERLLSHCCYVSSEYIEEHGGLYRVLTSEEMLESDAAAERQDRRSRQGYVAPADAAAFLAFARRSSRAELLAAKGLDPITQAYFRQLPKAFSGPRGRSTGASVAAASPPATVPLKVATSSALLETLREAGILEEVRPAPLLLGAQGGGDSAGAAADESFASLFREALFALHAQGAAGYFQRMEEMAYLANLLIAGCHFAGRNFRQLEALEAAVAVCNLGLEQRMISACEEAAALVAQEGVVKLFSLGWHQLYHEVCLPAAASLERLLQKRQELGGEEWDPAEGAKLLRAVAIARQQGNPWSLRPKLDPLETLLPDEPIEALKALLDECPTLVGPLLGPKGVSATDATCRHPWRFIATGTLLRRAQAFLATF